MATAKKSPKLQTESPLIPLKYQHLAAIATIVLSLIIFFHQIIFDGKVFVAADSIASKSFETLVSDAATQNAPPLWNPYIFCGMPGVASLMVGGPRDYDISAYLYGKIAHVFSLTVQNGDIAAALFYYLILGVGTYFFVHDKVKNKAAALIAGLAVMHSTRLIILVMIGHMTKVPVICFFPWIFLILERLHEKFDLKLFLLLILVAHFMFMPGHMQMIFYVYFAFLIYYLFFLIRSFMKKENWKGYVRSGISFAAASGLAFLMTGDQYLSTLEYSKYTMRGAGPIVASQQTQQNATSSGGLDYDYATQWSFSPGETFTFLIPSLYGFGDVKYSGVLTQNQEVKINTYLGPQTFADTPQYMGIVVLILAGIGFWKNRKNPFVMYSGILIVISLFISYGKEFPLLFDPMFNYFPMFNKFRIPNMILILVQMMVPVLAGFGVAAMLNGTTDEKEKKQWLYAAGIMGGLLLISVIARDVFLSIYEAFFTKAPFVEKGYRDDIASELFKFVSSLVANDITAALLFLTVIFGGIYLYWKHTLSLNIVIALIIVVLLADLWRANYQPMDPQPHHATQELFTTPEYVKFLKTDTTLYRTLQFENGRPPFDNTLAYWRIQSAYGYSGTKMRQIQDAYDVCGVGNPLLWGLMNVKYIISDRPDSNQILLPVYKGEKFVIYNRGLFPRAFFVKKYEVATGLEILNNIKEMKFNPMEVSYVMEDPKIAIDPPQENASAEYVQYGMHDLALNVHATGNNLLFLSEAWYPEGWKAFVDGTETPIYRLNYMFRGVVVPAGEHTVTMKFEPSGFYLGKQLSLWINILVLGGLGYFGVMYLIKAQSKKTINS